MRSPLHRFSVVIAAGFAPFAAFILFAAARMPMSYDDAYNATVPLNLLRGNGYSTSFGRLDPFDPDISSGAAFLAPAAVPMALFGANLETPMLYTAVLCLALSLLLLRSLHAHAPPAALATALLVPFTLWHGKNDTVVMESALPAPPFGYWYQLLGNLPGLLALALAMSLLVERRPMTAARAAAAVALIVFGVNAKAMHVFPLIGMVVLWAALPPDHAGAPPRAAPRGRRVAVGLGLLAAGWCGLRLNRALAWWFLDARAFGAFVHRETALMDSGSGIGRLFSASPPPLALAKTIVWNALRAVWFLGGAVQGPIIVAGLVATVAVAWRARRRSALARITLAFLAGMAAHFAWWACLPSHPTRHLTPLPPLACLALGCGFALWYGSRGSNAASVRPWHRGAPGAVLALLCLAGVPNLVAALGGWSQLREYREEQEGAAATLERLALEYPDAAFCAPDWYVPRELTYLAPEGVRYCDLSAVAGDAPGRRILMRSTLLWPARRKRSVRATGERCTTVLDRVGHFEFLGCDGFRP